MKVLTLVGARPQFIKLAPLSNILRQSHAEFILHTGQHFDHNMSEIFFKEMGIPEPDINLGIVEKDHGKQTAEMLTGIEDVLKKERPDRVVVFGDTNSTLAGALAASKLHIPTIHVEAGLRSHDKGMPEEINRIVTDHISTYLACPSQLAIENLKKESLISNAFFTGDIMYDAILEFSKLAKNTSLETPKKFILLTIHRASNTTTPTELTTLFQTLEKLKIPVIFPIHPRTKAFIQHTGISIPDTISCIPPVGYIDMIALIQKAFHVITDSGGLQKDAFFLNTPCSTYRNTTEWEETLITHHNALIITPDNQINTTKLTHRLLTDAPTVAPSHPYGTGNAAEEILRIIEKS